MKCASNELRDKSVRTGSHFGFHRSTELLLKNNSSERSIHKSEKSLFQSECFPFFQYDLSIPKCFTIIFINCLTDTIWRCVNPVATRVHRFRSLNTNIYSFDLSFYPFCPSPDCDIMTHCGFAWWNEACVAGDVIMYTHPVWLVMHSMSITYLFWFTSFEHW